MVSRATMAIVAACTIVPLPLLLVVAGWLGYLDTPRDRFVAWIERKRREKAGQQAYDPKTGLGRGAPGFQTNVRRIAVPRSQVVHTADGIRILDSPPAKEEDEWIPAGHSASSGSGRKSGSTRSSGSGGASKGSATATGRVASVGGAKRRK